MKMTRRLGLAFGAVAALGLFAGGTASSSLASTALAVGASGSGSAIACPAIEGANSTIGCGGYPIAWFPPNGMLPGLTVTGQAMLNGSGPKVRDEAIRIAVADAKEQAEVAADAAGAKLGQVLSIQVSGSGYPYPIGIAADGGASSSTGGASPVCKPNADCPPTVVPESQTFVSVTVTWALAS